MIAPLVTVGGKGGADFEIPVGVVGWGCDGTVAGAATILTAVGSILATIFLRISGRSLTWSVKTVRACWPRWALIQWAAMPATPA